MPGLKVFASMNYREYKPIPGLEGYVECVWLLEGPAGGRSDEWHRVFPDGCIDLVFGRGDPVLKRMPTGEVITQPRSGVIGHKSEPLWLKPTGTWKTAGIKLRPESALAVLNVNLAGLFDSSVPLDVLWGRVGRDIMERVLSAKSPGEALRVFQVGLLNRLASTRRPHPATVRAVRALVDARGLAPIGHLARAVGWSERNLERRFNEEVGVSPKVFSRTLRFLGLLSSLSSQRNESWAALAWDSGFADQAHLTREVRRFAGSSPAKLGDQNLDLARQLVSPDRLRAYFRGTAG